MFLLFVLGCNSLYLFLDATWLNIGYKKNWQHMKRPRLVMYVNSSSELGGADTDLLTICKYINREKFKPVVLLPHPGPLSVDLINSGVDLYYIDPSPIKRFKTISQYVLYPWYFLAAAYKIRKLINILKPSIIHINTSVLPAVGWAAKLCGVPCVWHVREINILKRPKIVGYILKKNIVFLSDLIIAISNAVAVNIGLQAAKKVMVIHHGIDTNHFNPLSKSNRLDCLYDKECYPIIGYVGRLAPWKGVDLLLKSFSEAIKKLPKAHLVLVASVTGYNHELENLSMLVNEYGIYNKVSWLLNDKNISDIYPIFDVLVVPSLDPEPFGLVIIEALASGCPVIASNHGGPIEILSNTIAGKLVEPNNIDAITKAIVDFCCESSTLMQQRRNAARCLAIEKFNIDRMIVNLTNAYEELLKSKGSFAEP